MQEAVAIDPTPRNPYQYKYQGQERQDELGLNWYSFKWRNYDYAIGRFMLSVDPIAEDYVYNSTYAFSENRVIDSVELEGLERIDVDEIEVEPVNPFIDPSIPIELSPVSLVHTQTPSSSSDNNIDNIMVMSNDVVMLDSPALMQIDIFTLASVTTETVFTALLEEVGLNTEDAQTGASIITTIGNPTKDIIKNGIKNAAKGGTNLLKLAKKYGINANSPTTKQLLENFDMKAADWIGKHRQGRVKSVLGDVGDKTIGEVFDAADSKTRKIILDGRFAK